MGASVNWDRLVGVRGRGFLGPASFLAVVLFSDRRVLKRKKD